MKCRVNSDRVEDVSKVFRILGLNGVKIFEEYDIQFSVAKQIVKQCPKIAHYLLYLNSLVSYRLMYYGEEFWMLFEQYVLNRCSDINEFSGVVNLVIDFTLKHNKIMARQKIDRLKRINRCSEIVGYVDGYEFEPLTVSTAKCLHSGIDSKTIVFSIKMLYYVLKAKGYEVVLPSTIPIPVDRRVALITYLSGLVDVLDEVNVYPLKLLRFSNIIRDVWQKVSLLTSIPPLHIDSVLWYLGRYSYSLSTKSTIFNAINRQLIFKLGEEIIKRLIEELFYRLPP